MHTDLKTPNIMYGFMKEDLQQQLALYTEAKRNAFCDLAYGAATGIVHREEREDDQNVPQIASFETGLTSCAASEEYENGLVKVLSTGNVLSIIDIDFLESLH